MAIFEHSNLSTRRQGHFSQMLGVPSENLGSYSPRLTASENSDRDGRARVLATIAGFQNGRRGSDRSNTRSKCHRELVRS